MGNLTPNQLRVFYCWQGDSPRETNGYFLREAIQSAIEEVNSELKSGVIHNFGGLTKENPLVWIDSYSFQTGSQIWPSRLFDNITESDIFIADLTFVADYDTSDKRRKTISNANVMLETGMAFGLIGRERVIGVINEAFGSAKNNLPSDFLGTEGPIRYKLPKKHSEPDRRTQLESLTTQIKENILLCVEHDLFRARKIKDKLNQFELAVLLKAVKTNNDGNISSEVDRFAIRWAIQQQIHIEEKEFEKSIDNREYHKEQLNYTLDDLWGNVINSLITKDVLWCHNQLDQSSGQYMFCYHLTALGKQVVNILYSQSKHKNQTPSA